jgi:hypothetical protein
MHRGWLVTMSSKCICIMLATEQSRGNAQQKNNHTDAQKAGSPYTFTDDVMATNQIVGNDGDGNRLHSQVKVDTARSC